MAKLALWVLVVVAVMLLVRALGPGKRRVGGRESGSGPGSGAKPPDPGDPQPRGNPGELMMGCAVCGVHVPSSDAVFARGKVYCGTDHRDQDEGRRSKGAP